MEDSDVKHAMLWNMSAQGLRMLNVKDYRAFVCVWTRFQRLWLWIGHYATHEWRACTSGGSGVNVLSWRSPDKQVIFQ